MIVDIGTEGMLEVLRDNTCKLDGWETEFIEYIQELLDKEQVLTGGQIEQVEKLYMKVY